MRKILLVLFLILCLLLAGCNQNSNIDTGEEAGTSQSVSVESESETTLTTEDETDNSPAATTGNDIHGDTTVNTETPVTKEPEATTTTTPDTTKKTETKVPETTESKTTVTDPPATEEPEETTSGSETTEPEETTPPKVYATKNDAEEIAVLVVKYINEYRSTQGAGALTQLPGITEFAEYRSRQLVSNFAHDTNDIRAAATALQYGEYFDPSVAGLDEEPYYRSSTMEAIAQTNKVGTVDEVAQHVATMAYNSPNHWSYVGGSGYYYVGVGLTYEANRWYCAITVSGVNNG